MPWPVAHGPDIAHYQNLTGLPPDPAWQLFSHKCSEGAQSGDATFQSRWKWMRTQGFRYRGAYHWLRSDSSIAAQAANVIARLAQQGGLRQGEFVQNDWETTPNIPVPSAEDAHEFNDRIRQHYGRECVITYTSDWLPDGPDPDPRGEFYEWREAHPDDALWFANYSTANPALPSSGWQECARYRADVWQFTSSFRHPSIESKSGGGFDMNHVREWATLDRIAGYTEPAPIPVPVPVPVPIPIPGPDVEEEDAMKIKTPGQWFQLVGVDVRAIGNGNAYAGLSGNEITLTVAEMAEVLETCRHTYGPVKAEMGAGFVQLWNAKAELPAGPGTPVAVPFPLKLTGTIQP